MKKKKLLRMIEQLEMQTNLRKAAVLALAHAVKPTNGFRYNYTMHLINHEFTSADIKAIDNFLRWASQRADSLMARGLGEAPSRDELLETFDEFVPQRKGELEKILQVDRSDGENGVLHRWARIVLDANHATQSNHDEVIVGEDAANAMENEP